jgi:hypothetical protein
MSHLFDRNGEPMTYDAWNAAFWDAPRRRVGLDIIGPVQISTIWDGGLGYRKDETGRPLIFETRIHLPGEDSGSAFFHWHTEAEAVQAHADLLRVIHAAVNDETELQGLRDMLRGKPRDPEFRA